LRHVNPDYWKILRVREPYAFGHRNARNNVRAWIVRGRSWIVERQAIGWAHNWLADAILKGTCFAT
jgi:hypothetical protein